MLFDILSRKRILAINFLQQVTLTVSDGAIVLHDQIFKRFHQFPLNIARTRGLDSSIRQSLSASHGVEEELMRFEPAVERAEDKSSGLGRVVIFAEMRQGSS
jgi:hypothetical protein